MPLLEKRAYFKPLEFPWAYEAYDLQQKMHWIPSEVPLHEDVKDWNLKLNKEEKSLLTQLFRFFTQADVDIAGGYIDKFLPIFKPPEIRMMLSAFANFEAIHVQGYSLLLDTVGMPEIEYSRFLEYEDMKAKHSYLEEIQTDTPENIAKALIYESAQTMVDLEDKFIDLAFQEGGIQGLTSEEVKTYIRYIADRRLLQLGMKTIYKQKKNPLDWIDWITAGIDHTNFFEARSVSYSKGALTGSWDEVWN
jgi:ribonucleotide reductase beta subunit family protein with ferritin-like domain